MQMCSGTADPDADGVKDYKDDKYDIEAHPSDKHCIDTRTVTGGPHIALWRLIVQQKTALFVPEGVHYTPVQLFCFPICLKLTNLGIQLAEFLPKTCEAMISGWKRPKQVETSQKLVIFCFFLLENV